MADRMEEPITIVPQVETINRSSEDEAYREATDESMVTSSDSFYSPMPRYSSEVPLDDGVCPFQGPRLPHPTACARSRHIKDQCRTLYRFLVVHYTWAGPAAPIEIAELETVHYGEIAEWLRAVRAGPEQASLVLLLCRPYRPIRPIAEPASQIGHMRCGLGICEKLSEVSEEGTEGHRSYGVYGRCDSLSNLLPTKSVGLHLKIPRTSNGDYSRLHVNVALRPGEMDGAGPEVRPGVFKMNDRVMNARLNCGCNPRGYETDDGGTDTDTDTDNNNNNYPAGFLAGRNFVYIEIPFEGSKVDHAAVAKKAWVDWLGLLSDFRFANRREFLCWMVDFALSGSLNFVESVWADVIDFHSKQMQTDWDSLVRKQNTALPSVDRVWNSDQFWDTFMASSQHKLLLNKHLEGLSVIQARLETDLGLRSDELPQLADSAAVLADLGGQLSRRVVEPIAEMSELVHKLVQFRDSRASLQLADSMWWLSWITFVFLPISSIASVFGMNVSWFEAGNPSPLYFFYVLVPTLMISLAFYYLTTRIFYPSRQLRELQEAELDNQQKLRADKQIFVDSTQDISDSTDVAVQIPLWFRAVNAAWTPIQPAPFQSPRADDIQLDNMTRLWVAADRLILDLQSRYFYKNFSSVMQESGAPAQPSFFARLFDCLFRFRRAKSNGSAAAGQPASLDEEEKMSSSAGLPGGLTGGSSPPTGTPKQLEEGLQSAEPGTEPVGEKQPEKGGGVQESQAKADW